jgi:hypothetical protein
MNAYTLRISIALIALVACGWTSLARADYRVTCESHNNKMQSCRLSEPGFVRMERKLSDAACHRGRDWDYDRRSIRVWDGCRAVFSVAASGYRGGRRHDHGNDSKDAKVAAGVVAGALIIGAIAAHKNAEDSRRGSGNAPGWMIGSFDGYNPKYDADIRLTVRSNGEVSVMAQGQTMSGWVDGNTLHVGGSEFNVEKTSEGFMTSQASDPDNEVYYRRQ